MTTEILMPTLSRDADEGIVVTWFVATGAQVAQGDLLCEVQVEKVSEEVRAPGAGRLRILQDAGAVVAQGAPLGVLEDAAATAPASAAPAALSRDVRAAGSGRTPAPSSPSARRLARELGVNLAGVAGSGPGGRIVEADVRATARGRPPGGPAPPPRAASVQPLSPMRRAIARRLGGGLAEAAQLTLTAEADVDDLVGVLARRGGSPTEAVVRACALALPGHPAMMARWSEDGLVPAAAVDVGVAVALEGGLVVPVVRDAGGKDLGALGREIRDLAARARSGALSDGETRGAVFSVTNLGAYRIDAFTPLLDPPQTAILGIGRARLRPAVVDGAVVPRHLLVLSLTFDHRVVDGAPAAAFLQQVLETLEDPARLL